MVTTDFSDKRTDKPVFDPRTLRMFVGALAFAFPSAVCALTGKVTVSISASYYEPETRDVFVGFLFIIGVLFIAYKGHVQKEQSVLWTWFLSFKAIEWIRKTIKPLGWMIDLTGTLVHWIKKHQEDIVSTIGGLAAIATALYPTARYGDPISTAAVIHSTGAAIMFIAVAYLCLIAFVRSLNRQILGCKEFQDHRELVRAVRLSKGVEAKKNMPTPAFVERILQVLRFVLPDAPGFLSLAGEINGNFKILVQQHKVEAKDNAFGRLLYLGSIYEKRLGRGVVYVLCGTAILGTLLGFVLLARGYSEWVATSDVTFYVETIALLFFGFSWMTASKLEYGRQLFALAERVAATIKAWQKRFMNWLTGAETVTP